MVRILVRTLFLAATVPAGARAGLQLTLHVPHVSFLQFEPIPATVTVFNDSNEPVVLGGRAGEAEAVVCFTVERRRDDPLPRLNPAAFCASQVVMPGEKRELKLDLTGWYDLSPMGRYMIWVECTWKGMLTVSGKTMFDVVRGLEAATATRSVPGDPLRQRTYSARYWSRDGAEQLFLCVTEQDGTVSYGTFPLGPIVRVHPPKVEVDVTGDVRILHQTTRDCFASSRFRSEPERVTFVRQDLLTPDGRDYKTAQREPVVPPLPLAPEGGKKSRKKTK